MQRSLLNSLTAKICCWFHDEKIYFKFIFGLLPSRNVSTVDLASISQSAMTNAGYNHNTCMFSLRPVQKRWTALPLPPAVLLYYISVFCLLSLNKRRLGYLPYDPVILIEIVFMSWIDFHKRVYWTWFI